MASPETNSGGGLNPFTSAIVQSFIELGLQTQQLAQLKSVYSQQMHTLNRTLREHLHDSVAFSEPSGGFFTWLRLPPNIDSGKILPEARRHQVSFPPGELFSPQRDLKNYIRLSFTYYEEPELMEGAQRLAAVVNRQLS